MLSSESLKAITISYLISALKGQEQFLQDATEAMGGGFVPRLSVSDLSNISIPLLPLSVLQQLGDTHIEYSTTNELITLRDELQGKDPQITELREQLYTMHGKDEENERLRTELASITAYYEDRISKIESQISSKDLRSRISHGETLKIEFKSSLRWNLKAE